MAHPGLRIVWGVVFSACSPELSLPNSGNASLPIVVEPPAASEAVSRAARFGSTTGQRLRLFEQSLTSRQLANIRNGEPGQDLMEAEIALLQVPVSDADAGAEGGETTWWVPASLLDAGQQYTVMSDSRHQVFRTLPNELVLARVWPETPFTGAAAFCLVSDRFLPLANPGQEPPALVEFGARRSSAELDAGQGGREAFGRWFELAHSPPCWFARAEDGAGELFTFPAAPLQPTWSGMSLEPRPEALRCTESELTLEWGCLLAQDDRVLVRGGETPTFWLVEGEAPVWFVSKPGRTGVVRGFSPEREYVLTFTVHFPRSSPLRQTVTFRTQARREHVVINEVLADPVTSEPAQEWVELYNDGANVADVGGWRLEDDGGSVTLPPVKIAPSGYALLVNDTYVENLPGDVVPEPNALVVRLPMLAKSGLSNSGESLRLFDKWDMLVSTFASTPKPTPGVSVARGVPWQVDADSETFGRHAAPGASPGSANVRVSGAVK